MKCAPVRCISIPRPGRALRFPLRKPAAVGVSVISRDIKSMVSLGYPVAGNTAESLSMAVTHYFDCLDYRTTVQAKTQYFNRTVDVMSSRTALIDAYAFAIGASR